jgi:hypothetical protein
VPACNRYSDNGVTIVGDEQRERSQRRPLSAVMILDGGAEVDLEWWE